MECDGFAVRAAVPLEPAVRVSDALSLDAEAASDEVSSACAADVEVDDMGPSGSDDGVSVVPHPQQ